MVKFPLTITAVVAGVALIIGVSVIMDARARLLKGVEDRALWLGHSLAAPAAHAVISNDYWSIYRTLKQVTSATGEGTRDPGILHAMVLDAKGRVLAHSQPVDHPVGLPLAVEERGTEQWLSLDAAGIVAQDAEGGWIEAVIPIRSGEDMLGSIRLRLSTNAVNAEIRETGLRVIAYTMLLVMFGSLFGAAISNRMIRPLHALSGAMDSMRSEGFTTPARVRVRDRDEIGQLVDAFNMMSAELVEKRRIEQELAVAEKISAIGRIAAGVAHEVNNPLGGMLNCVNTLKKHGDDPGILGRYLPLLERGLKRIQGIVHGLLVEVRAERADTWGSCQCLDDMRELVAGEMADRNIRLDWQVNTPDGVSVNCEKVQQIVLNLLRNAIEATPEGGVVTFRADLEDDRVCFQISDSGCGIPQEHATRIFDPFFTTKASGTGLGLWIVYRLVESLEGSIGVTSDPGNGSTFQVSLPARNEETTHG